MRDDDPTIPHLTIEELIGNDDRERVSIEPAEPKVVIDTGVIRLADMVASASTAPPEPRERFEISSTDIPPPPPPRRRMGMIVSLAVAATLLVSAVIVVFVSTERDRAAKRERIRSLAARIDGMATPRQPPADLPEPEPAPVPVIEAEPEVEPVEEEEVEEAPAPKKKHTKRQLRRRWAWRRAKARMRAKEEVVLTAPAAAPEKGSGKPSRKDIRRAMKPVSRRAGSCVSHAGGTVQLKIIVSGDGSVRSASALGSHRGTSTGRCVEQAAKSARFDPFEGQFFTFTYPIRLR